MKLHPLSFHQIYIIIINSEGCDFIYSCNGVILDFLKKYRLWRKSLNSLFQRGLVLPKTVKQIIHKKKLMGISLLSSSVAKYWFQNIVSLTKFPKLPKNTMVKKRTTITEHVVPFAEL